MAQPVNGNRKDLGVLTTHVLPSMSDSYEILEITDSATWDDFVRGAGGSVFSTRAWLDCAENAIGDQVRCYGCYKNGLLLAAVSGMEKRRNGISQLSTPVLTPHGGLLCAPVPGKGPAKVEAGWNRAAGLLIDHLIRIYAHVRLIHTPPIQDLRPFTWAGWDAQVRYTYHLALGSLDGLWDRLERRTRTVIRKAERTGFHFRPTDDTDLLRRQYTSIYARHNTKAPLDPALVQRFARKVLEENLAQAFVVESAGGEAASIVVFVKGFDMAHAWVSGQNPAFNSTGAASLLYWRFFAHTTFEKFDFGGANIPPIALFKRGFGGDLVSYFMVEGFANALVRAAVRGRRAARRLLQR